MKELIDKTAVLLDTTPGNKVVRDIRSLEMKPFSTASVVPGDAIARGQANLMVGAYRGGLAYVDLDKLVVQPLVQAESQHILGQLDGRLLNYDRVPVTFTAGEAIALTRRARLTVPAGQVWYVKAVQLYAAKDTTCTFDVNWRCSLWPDVVATGTTPDADGQAFLAYDGVGTNAINIWNFLFGVAPVTTNIGPGISDALYLGNDIATPKTQPTLLRLPGGTVLTAQVTVRTNVVVLATIDVTMSIFGYVAKALVS